MSKIISKKSVPLPSRHKVKGFSLVDLCRYQVSDPNWKSVYQSELRDRIHIFGWDRILIEAINSNKFQLVSDTLDIITSLNIPLDVQFILGEILKASKVEVASGMISRYGPEVFINAYQNNRNNGIKQIALGHLMLDGSNNHSIFYEIVAFLVRILTIQDVTLRNNSFFTLVSLIFDDLSFEMKDDAISLLEWFAEYGVLIQVILDYVGERIFSGVTLKGCTVWSMMSSVIQQPEYVGYFNRISNLIPNIRVFDGEVGSVAELVLRFTSSGIPSTTSDKLLLDFLGNVPTYPSDTEMGDSRTNLSPVPISPLSLSPLPMVPTRPGSPIVSFVPTISPVSSRIGEPQGSRTGGSEITRVVNDTPKEPIHRSPPLTTSRPDTTPSDRNVTSPTYRVERERSRSRTPLAPRTVYSPRDTSRRDTSRYDQTSDDRDYRRDDRGSRSPRSPRSIRDDRRDDRGSRSPRAMRDDRRDIRSSNRDLVRSASSGGVRDRDDRQQSYNYYNMDRDPYGNDGRSYGSQSEDESYGG